MRHVAFVAVACLIVTACSSPSRSASSLPFFDHPITRVEAVALDDVPPAERAGKADFGTGFGAVAGHAGRLLDLGLEFGGCWDQTPKVETVVRAAPDRLVVSVRLTPPHPRTALTPPKPTWIATGIGEAECGGVGMSRGMHVTLPSDETFTGTIEVREAA